MNWKLFMAAVAVFALLCLMSIGLPANLERANFVSGAGYVYPSATISSPTNGTVYHSSTLSCTFNTSILNPNHQNIQNYEEWSVVYLDNKILQTLQYLPSSYTLTLGNLTDGQHHLEVTANTKSAILTADFETGRSTVDFTIQLPQPNSTPAPSPTLPSSLSASLAESASSLYFGNTINFTVTAQGGKEPFTYTWNVDNQTTETSSSPYYSNDTLAVGEHHVYVQVTDAENNTAIIPTVAFDVLPNPSSSPAPSPSPSVPEFPAWILLLAFSSCLGALVYVRKSKIRSNQSRL